MRSDPSRSHSGPFEIPRCECSWGGVTSAAGQRTDPLDPVGGGTKGSSAVQHKDSRGVARNLRRRSIQRLFQCFRARRRMMETITEAVARHAASQPDAIALTDGLTSLTWHEVKTWMDDAARWLSDLGLPRGASMLGWLPNCLEWYLMRLACEQAGFFWVPVPTSQGRRELASILERTRPSVLVTKDHFRDHDYRAEADEVCSQIDLEPLHITAPDEGLLRLVGRSKARFQPLRLEESAHALATSGSEGTPKLAIYTLLAACTRAHSQAQLLKLTAEDKVLVLSPGTGPARVG
ncbi:MAG: long-chain fatty acid--CoA ligase, partial [Actinomycetota bacterium]